MEENNNLTQLHTALVNKGAVTGSVDDFKTYLSDDKNRNDLFEALKKKGAVTGSFNDFTSWLGMGKNTTAASQPTATKYQLPTFQPYQRELDDSPASILSPTQLKIARGEIGEGDTYTLQPGEDIEAFTPLPNFTLEQTEEERQQRQHQPKPQRQTMRDGSRMLGHNAALTRLAQDNGIATQGFENLNELGEDAMKIYALTPQGKADKQNMDNAAELAYDDFAADYLKNGSDQDIKAQLELGRQKQLLEQENAALAKDIEAWKAHPGTEQQLNALNARIRDLNKRIGAYEAAVAQSDKAQEKVNEAFQKWLENDDYYKAVAQQYEQNYEVTMGDWFDSAATPLYMQMTKDEIAKMKSYLDDESLNLDHRQRTAIKRRVKDAEAWVKAAEKNGWLDKTFAGMQGKGAGIDIATMFRGMGNAIDFDLLDFGIGEAIDDATLRRISEKVRDKGEASLTPEERAVLLSDEALGLTKSVFNVDESAWNAGANTAEMLPFIVELWLSGGANAAIKAGVKGAVKGGAKGFRQGLKAGWKSAMKPTASQLGRLGEASRFAPKSVGQVAKEVRMTAAEIVDNGLFYALTTGSGHTISQLNQYMTPEIDANFDFGTGKWDVKGIAVDEDGNIKGGDKFGIAALKAIGMQAIEGGSEMLGEKALQPLLDRGGYWLRGMMGRQGRAMYKPYLRVVDDWIGHGALKNISGFGTEYAEELAGSVMRVITGLSTWDQEFNKQNLADTAYGLMPAQVAFAILGGGRMVGHARRSSQAKDLLDKYAPEQAAFYDRVAKMSTYDGADMLDRKTLEILKTIDEKKNNGTLTDEDQRKAAAELGMIFTMQEQIYMDEASAYMKDKQGRRMYEGITSNLNENGMFTVYEWNHDGTTERVPVLSTKDGKATVRLWDGKKQTVYLKDLSFVGEYTPEQAMQFAGERQTEFDDYAYTDQTTPMAGSVYYDADGNIPIVPGKGEVNITEVADNGDVTFTTDDGTKQTMNERKFYDYMRALRDAYEVTAGELAAWRVEADTKGKTAAENDDPQAHYGVGREARMARRALANAIGEERMAELERMDGEQLTREYMMADEKTQDLMYDWMQNRVGDSYGEAMNQRRQQAMVEWKQRIGRLPYDNGNVTTAVHNGNIVIVEDNDGQQAAIVDMAGNKSMVQSSELSNMQDNSLDSVAAQATMPQQAQLTALEQAYNGTTFQAGQEYTIGTDVNGEERKAIIVSVNEDGTISYATEYGYDKEGNPTPAARSVKVATAEGFRDMTENARKQRATQEQGQQEAAQQRADMGELRNGQRVTIMDGGHPVQGTINMPYTGQVQVFTDTQKLIKFDTIDDLKKSIQDAANALQTEQQAAIEAVANRINELANAMPNARIKVVTDINELRPDAQEFAKQDKLEAYFDPATNTVVFYAPGLVANNSNVDGKVIHEVVIHYGLKNMLGEKDYAALCLNIFNNVMDDNDRAKYVQYVKDSHPNSTLTDEQIMAMAADEWIAFTYENRDIDSIKRESLLQTIVNFIVDLFKKAGVDLNRDEVMAELDQLVAASRDWLRGEQVNQEEKKEEAPKEEEKKEEPQPEPTKTREELIANAVQAAANFAAQGDPNFVNDNLDKAKKRVNNAKKRKPTSTNPAKRQEQIEKINTELAAAENELAFWNDVQAVINEAQLAGQTRLNEADQALQELDGNLNPTVEAEEVHKYDKEPSNADEAAADFLVGFVKKQHRINEQSLMQETGWSEDEVKNFRPATTPDGGMTLQEAAENLYNEYESEGSEHGWFKDPSDARDKLISVMQEAGKYGELANYIYQRRGDDKATQQMQAALDYNAQQLGYADAQDMHDKRMAEAQTKLEELKDEHGSLSEEALQQFKDFTQGLMIGQEETPTEQPTESIEGEGEYYQPTNEEAPFSVVTGNSSEEEQEEAYFGEEPRYSVVTDPQLLDELNNGKTIKVYRAMQMQDGRLYPPMAGKVNGQWQKPIELGVWEQADEHPELVDKNGKFKLDKGNGSSVAAAYNPYLHTSRSPLNDQFSSAWNRPELVTVEVEVPESELTSGYKADKAKDAVGEVEWKSGPVSGQLAKLGNPRKVILSRYDKPVRIVPNKEVSQRIAEMLKDTDIEVPFNTVTPELRQALEEQGVKIGKPQKGNAGDASMSAYNEWKSNKPLPIDQQTPKNTTIDQVLYSIKVNHNSPYLLKRADGSFIDPDTGERLGFDHRFMNTGEGAQAHGWGSYFSVSDLRGYADARNSNNTSSMRAANITYGVDWLEKNPTYEDWVNSEETKRYYDTTGTYKYIEELKKRGPEWEGDVKLYEEQAKERDRQRNDEKHLHEEYEKLRNAHLAMASRHHYEVEIPDNNGENYLDEKAILTKDQLDRIATSFHDITLNILQEKGRLSDDMADWRRGNVERATEEIRNHNDVTTYGLYRELIDHFSEEKDVSRIFLNAGFTGIHYYGMQDGECYVIFDENDAKIVDHVRFSVTGNNAIFADIINEQGELNYDKLNEHIQRVKDGTERVSRLSEEEIGREDATPSIAAQAIARGVRDSRLADLWGTDKAREQTRLLIKEWAKKNKYWYGKTRLEKDATERKGNNKESRVFISNDYSIVRKLTKPFLYTYTQPLIEAIESFGNVFPETAYTIKGFAENKDGQLCVVTEQPYIDGVPLSQAYPDATQREKVLTDFMEGLGFNHYGYGVYGNNIVGVYDLHGGNVIVDANGDLFVIDAIMRTNQRHFGNDVMFSVTGLITNEQGEIDYDRVTNNGGGVREAVSVEDRSRSEASRQRGDVQGVRQGDRGDNNQGQPDQGGNGASLGRLNEVIQAVQSGQGSVSRIPSGLRQENESVPRFTTETISEGLPETNAIGERDNGRGDEYTSQRNEGGTGRASTEDVPRPDEETRFSIVTPQQDAAYMDAVNRGDMETAQRMVMEAAKAAMHNTKVVDENGNPLVVYRGEGSVGVNLFTSFDRNKTQENGFFFTPIKKVADVYSRNGGYKTRVFYLDASNLLDLTKDTEDNRAFVSEWASVFDEWINKESGENIDPWDLLQTGILFDYEDNQSSERWRDLQATVEVEGYDAIILPDYDSSIGVFPSYVVFSPSQIKSADPVTYDDDGNVIPLSERFNEGNDDIRYSVVSPESQAIFDKAKEIFGTTSNINEAGYILPDGAMLDFSGRKDLDEGTDDDFLRGRRTEDHRDIQQIEYEKDGNTPSGVNTDMPDFIRRGAIRIDSNAGVINLAVKPTQQQRWPIRRIVEANDGDVQVDFGDGWDSDHYVEYDGAKPSRVLADIDRYFDEGVKPEGNAMFSVKKSEKDVADKQLSLFLQNNSGEYETQDGQTIGFTTILDGDNSSVDSGARPSEVQRENGATNPTDYHLRKLDPGETCHVERRYVETQGFDFTGSEKIETTDDVAYIFKQLENAAIENSFVVLIKDGTPTVIHTGIGTYDQTIVNLNNAMVAYQKLNPDKVYFVHNHPSGNIVASNPDKRVYANAKKLFGDKLQPGIIIDTTSGLYGTFTDTTEDMDNVIPKEVKNETPIKTYSFSKQVFEKDWKPSKVYPIRSSNDVATFVSSHRLGEHKKMSLLILTPQHNVIGNIFLPYTSLSEAPQGIDFANEVGYYINQMGGVTAILYGNFRFDSATIDKIQELKDGLKIQGLNLTDCIHISPTGDRYKSAIEARLLGENEAEYGRLTDEQIREILSKENADTAGDPVLYSVSQAANTPQERLRLYDAMNGEKYASNFVGRVTEGFYRSVVDGAIPLKRLQDVIAGRGKVTDAENAYLMEIARAARAKRLTDEAETKYYEPMMKAIAALTGRTSKKGYYKAMRDVELYVLAKSGLERNQWFWDEAKKSDPNAQLEDKSGLTALAAEFGEKDFTAFAQRLVADYEARHGQQKIDELWKCINAVSKNILDTELDGHLISQELHDDLLNRWKFYVPMRGFDEPVTSAYYFYQPSSATIRFENPFKKIKGRVSLADNPFVNLIRMTESAINLKGKNEVGLALLNLAASHDDNGLLRVGKAWEVKEVDPATGEVTWKAAYPKLSNVSQADIPAAIDAFQKSMMRQAKTGDARPSSRTAGGVRIHPTDIDQHVLKVKVGGQTVDLYLLGNPKAFQALNPTGKNKTGEKLSGLTRSLSGLMTTYNPVFMVRNSIRDFKTAAIITYTRDGAAGMFNMMGQWFGNMNALRKLIKGESSGDAKLDQYWQEFLEFGGETGFTRSLNMEKQREDFNKKMFNLTRDKSGQVIHKLTHGYFDWMEKHGNRYAEDITRFAVFCASRKQGRSAMQAAADAKNTTANFNKKGQSGFARFMSTNFAFFNAAIQGLNTSFHAFKDNPGRAATAAVSTMIYSMAIPFVNMCLLALFGDDDDWRQYENMTQFVSNTHAVYYIPGAGFLTMPYPQDFVPFTSLGNIIWRNAAGFEKPLNGRSIFGNVMLQWFDTWADLLPVNAFEEGFGEMKDWKGVARALAPTWLSPVADVMLNRNFMGSQIRRKHFTLNDQKDLAPYWAEYDRSKNWWAHDIARLIAGGDEYRAAAAWRNVDPRQLIHLVEGYGGGTVKLVSDIAVYFEEMAKGDKPTLNQAPFIKKFWIQPNPDKYEGNLNGKLYEMAKYQRELEQQIKDLQKEADKAREDGNDKAAEKREKKIEEIQSSMEYKILTDYDVNGKMKKWREERNDITNDGTLSEEGKQDKIVKLTYQKAAFLDGIWEEAFLGEEAPKRNWFSDFYYDKKGEQE